MVDIHFILRIHKIKSITNINNKRELCLYPEFCN